MRASYDVVVIGSGFGGSVSALRLTEKGYRVGVLEAGRRYRTGEFATTNWNLKRFLWGPRLGLYGIQRIDLLANVLVLSGAGVGGGSLVYANTSYEPHDAFYTDPQWGKITDWKQELAPFYATAKRMLGVEEASADTPADDVMRTIAQRLGVEDTFRPTPVAVYLGEPGVETDDPYFGGAGPRRSGCTLVGACMIGCNNNAKNTLDKNYLYLAEQAGAAVHADAEVIDLEPMRDGGWQLTTQQPGPRSGRNRRVFFAHQVIFSAGALGTTRLLLKLIDAGRLGNISEQAGQLVRTNSEVLLGATAHSTDVDYSQGVAITSSVHPEPHTHIEPVRYPKGSSAMGLLATVLTDGGPGLPRPAALSRQRPHSPGSVGPFDVPTAVGRALGHPSCHAELRQFAAIDPEARHLRHSDCLASATVNPIRPTSRSPTRQLASRRKPWAETRWAAVNEVLLNRPTTAHILGGAAIGSDPSSGVIDAYHRVFGHPGLHVVDGAAVGANLGVNPSLSITAMSERAMAMWPNKGEADPRPTLGSEYRVVGPVRPNDPVVDPSVLGIDPWSSDA